MLEYSKTIILNYLREAGHYLSAGNIFNNHRALIVQQWGLGNSILTTPMVIALSRTGKFSKIDVLVNKRKSTDLVFKNWELIDHIYDVDELSGIGKNIYYDYLLECHPGKILPKNVKYRHRIKIPVKTGYAIEYYWDFKEHEADYLMKMARKLGYVGERPSIRKIAGDKNCPINIENNTVAIGIGYIKGFGTDCPDRHWGNDNFRKLCNKLSEMGFIPVLIGDSKDQEVDGKHIESSGIKSICGKPSLPQLVHFISECVAYVGNDSGLMHLAASQNIPTIGIFVSSNSIKSHPLCDRCAAIGGDKGRKYYNISVDQVISEFKKIIDYDK